MAPVRVLLTLCPVWRDPVGRGRALGGTTALTAAPEATGDELVAARGSTVDEPASVEPSSASSRRRRRGRAAIVAGLVLAFGVLGASVAIAGSATGPAFVAVAGSPTATGHDPDSVVFSPNDGLLADTSYLDNNVSIFKVSRTGALSAAAGSPFSVGHGPFTAAFSPSGGLLVTSNNTDNDLSMFTVAATGVLTPVSSPISTGAGTDPTSATFSPSGSLLAVTELGTDTVQMYTVSSGGALAAVGSPVVVGTNPPFYTDDATFSPNGDYLAVVDETTDKMTAGKLYMFAVSSGGALTAVTGSPFTIGEKADSASFSPDGKLLVVANIDSNSLSIFTVASNGVLAPTTDSPYSTGASQPWDAEFGPSGLLAVLSNNLNTTSLYSVTTTGPSAGTLTPLAGSPLSDGSASGPQWTAFSNSGLLVATVNQTGDNISVFSVAPPIVAITASPAAQFYTQNQAVSTSFSCSDSTYAPGLTSCSDSNGVTGPTGSSGSTGPSGATGTLGTATLGPHAYTVTATSSDGETTITPLDYTVASPPSASISAPAGGATFAVGQAVPTTFSCTDSTYGPGIQSCTPSFGAAGSTSAAGTGVLDTAAPGLFSYTVTAVSADGQSATSAPLDYSVAQPPRATITAPAGGGVYTVGEYVPTTFSCSDGGSGSGIRTCDPSYGPAGSPNAATTGTLDTSAPGSHSYTVTATSNDGLTAATTIGYTVQALPPVLTTTLSGSSNAFKVLAVNHASNGTIKLTLKLPGPGSVVVLGTHAATGGGGTLNLGRFELRVTHAGTLHITVRPNAAGRRLLTRDRRHGSALHIRVLITFTPRGGRPRVRALTVPVLDAGKQ